MANIIIQTYGATLLGFELAPYLDEDLLTYSAVITASTILGALACHPKFEYL